VGVEQPDVSSPALADRYAQAFAAHLGEGGESGLGAAYALGREAVAAQVSVLDFADAHHRALTVALASASPADQGEIVRAGAEFLRESLSMFEIAARGYHEVQEIARIEHEHIEQLRALAEASLAINASLTDEEILQLTADAAREALGVQRASIAILAAEPRRPPLGATSPTDLEVSTATPSRLSVSLQAQGRELGSLEVVDRPEREFTARDDAVLTQLGQLTAGAVANARLYMRERTIARTLQRSPPKEISNGRRSCLPGTARVSVTTAHSGAAKLFSECPAIGAGLRV